MKQVNNFVKFNYILNYDLKFCNYPGFNLKSLKISPFIDYLSGNGVVTGSDPFFNFYKLEN